MIVLIFVQGSEIMKFRIVEKDIEISGKSSGYEYIPFNPIRTADELSRLRAKYGEKWLREHQKAERDYEKMETEEEIAEDLIKDFKKTAWRLVKRDGGT